MLAAGQEPTRPLEAEGGSPLQIALPSMGNGDGIPGCFGWVLATIERVALTRTVAMPRRFRFTQTQTQARLAEMLCDGMRPTHTAAMPRVKISTVRTHFDPLFEKTGTRSQAQRVALLHQA